jgi:hypothetical protein
MSRIAFGIVVLIGWIAYAQMSTDEAMQRMKARQAAATQESAAEDIALLKKLINVYRNAATRASDDHVALSDKDNELRKELINDFEIKAPQPAAALSDDDIQLLIKITEWQNYVFSVNQALSAENQALIARVAALEKDNITLAKNALPKDDPNAKTLAKGMTRDQCVTLLGKPSVDKTNSDGVEELEWIILAHPGGNLPPKLIETITAKIHQAVVVTDFTDTKYGN